MQILTASHKIYFQYLNYKELLYTITFTYVTFAAQYSGRAYVIAVSYRRFVILEYCFLQDSLRKSVSFK
jgi:hypothetical protein